MQSGSETRPSDYPAVTNSSTPAEKIGLFRSLFRGREDVYPRRFKSRKTGKAGYALACANEWVRRVCEKPKIKCAECRFLPVTDEVAFVEQRLGGCSIKKRSANPPLNRA
jgi:hypothetical protein